MSPPNIKSLRCGACTWSGCDVVEFHDHLMGHSESGSYYFHGPTLTGHPEITAVRSAILTNHGSPIESFPHCVSNNTNSALSLDIVKTEPSCSGDQAVEATSDSQHADVVGVTKPELEDDSTQDYILDVDETIMCSNTCDGNSSDGGVCEKSTLPTFGRDYVGNEKKSLKRKQRPGKKMRIKLNDGKLKDNKAMTDDAMNNDKDNVGTTDSLQCKEEENQLVCNPDLHSHLEDESIKQETCTTSETKIKVRKAKSRHRQADSVFPCHLCMYIDRPHFLYIHIETVHDGDYRWKCTSCLLPFLTQQAYDKHMNWCKSTWCKSHACMYCYNERLFLSREKLVAHINTHHNQTFPLQCNVCKEPLASKFDEECHMSKHEDKLLKCRFCNATCKSVVRREQHTMKHILNDYTCYICEKEYGDEYTCLNHTLKHIDGGDCICEKCGLSFGNQSLLREHMYTCIKKFVCQICDKKFSRLYRVKNHMLCVHGEGIPFVCDKCGAQFSQSSALNRHCRNAHSSEKRFVCKICSKGFNVKRAYDSHVLIHENKHPYECEHCGKAFRMKWNLKTHIRQHTGEKPYSCTKCGMCFTHNVVRKGHESKCTGV